MENYIKYIGRDVNELPEDIDNCYPIVDNDSDEIISFINADGYIMMQGNLPAKYHNYVVDDDFEFNEDLGTYFL